jgi:hypothetical protein
MPRFFFDIDDGARLYSDNAGVDLASVHEARDEASCAMGEMAREHLPSAKPQKSMMMWFRNEDGSALLSLSLSF